MSPRSQPPASPRTRLATLALTAAAIGTLWSVGSATPESLPAQESAAADGITVIGRASYTLTAGHARIRLDLTETDEVASVALENLRAAATRLASAVESVQSGTVTMTRNGPGFGPETADTMAMMMAGGMAQDTSSAPKVQVSETFVLTVAEPAEGASLAGLVAEVLEAASDAGAGFVQNNEDPQMALIRMLYGQEQTEPEPPVRFLAHDLSGRSQALELAMRAARKEAEELANHGGVTLGNPLAIRSLAPAGLGLAGAGSESYEVVLEVRFAIN